MALSFSSPLTNNPTLRGSLAAPKQRFGDHGRYAVAPVHTRFDVLEWVVWDADIIKRHSQQTLFLPALALDLIEGAPCAAITPLG